MDTLELSIQSLSMQIAIASAPHNDKRLALKHWETCGQTYKLVLEQLEKWSTSKYEERSYVIDSYDKLKIMIGSMINESHKAC